MGTKGGNRNTKAECIPSADGFETALKVHEQNGHFGLDHTKLKLRDRYFWPGLDKDSRKAVTQCPKCKNFGPHHINSLLQPIKRREPFDLICADYLSLPKGRNGWKTVLLMIDTFSNFIWAYKLKTAGTGKSTVDGLKDICAKNRKPDAFMADGGSHFRNEEVSKFCEARGIQHITTPAYAPWTNGLIENANKILLGRLRRLCAPDIDDSGERSTDAKATPVSWPDHLEEAVRTMNDRI